MSRIHTKAAQESYGFILLVAAILVLVNVLGVFISGRIDLTENRLFSLSDGSERVAERLKDKLEIVAYFTEDLPPPFNATQRYVKDILEEYEAESEGNVTVRYVNPDTEEEEDAAQNDGVFKVSHQVLENDSVSVREGYRGIALRYLGESKAIPVVQDTSGLEYQITQLMKQLVGDKAPVGVVTGHQGPDLQKGLTSLQQAAPTYEFSEVEATSAIDSKLQALLVVDPTQAFTESEVKNLEGYLEQGGGLGIFGGGLRVSTEGAEPSASPVDSGLKPLLDKWGLAFGEGVVADAQCGRAPMQTTLGIPIFVPYPPVPIVSFTEEQAEHPTLFRLNQIAMPFTSPVSVKKNKPDNVKRTVLAKSSENSWLMTGDNISVTPRQPNEWSQSGRGGPFALAVALEAQSKSNGFRALVVGTGGVLRDEYLPKSQGQGEQDATGALAFGLNALDWLAQDADLIAIRAKSVEDPALEVPSSVREAEDVVRAAEQERDRGKAEKGLARRQEAIEAWETKKALYRWLNTLGLPLVFALFGVFRWRSRQSKKAQLKV